MDKVKALLEMKSETTPPARPVEITIQGTAEQQKTILKLLRQYSFVNHDNEITFDQACTFFGYLKTESEYNDFLQKRNMEHQRQIEFHTILLKDFRRLQSEFHHLQILHDNAFDLLNECLERKRELEINCMQKDLQILKLEDIIEQRDRTNDYVVDQIVAAEAKVKSFKMQINRVKVHGAFLRFRVALLKRINKKLKTGYQGLEQRVRDSEEKLAVTTCGGCLTRKNSDSEADMDESDAKRHSRESV
ncbi:uncharacterized protein RCO7_06489 [Rhynchosporium graminicola]|uniref:Uncharacterized protein n=1 Tax=Rhynchosporium graminicola TaxID=2792576 RepID=A0A1E1KDY6_9HELO|nr:uncharacterized protein RCO7_06489 [Rhynchosporium commune]